MRLIEFLVAFALGYGFCLLICIINKNKMEAKQRESGGKY